MEAGGITSSQYIQHHLEHLTLNLRTFTIDGNGGFWTLNLDTLIVSIFIGFLVFGCLGFVAARLTEIPGKLQNMIELIVGFVDGAVHDVFHHKTTFIPALSLTLFLWIFFMNAMDLLRSHKLPKNTN